MYTRVLIGNMNLERMKWPSHKKMTGADVDMIARAYLNFVGVDFDTATGHGVGHYSGVHEFPPQIDPLGDIPLNIG